jgi:hypothetical protein
MFPNNAVIEVQTSITKTFTDIGSGHKNTDNHLSLHAIV